MTDIKMLHLHISYEVETTFLRKNSHIFFREPAHEFLEKNCLK